MSNINDVLPVVMRLHWDVVDFRRLIFHSNFRQFEKTAQRKLEHKISEKRNSDFSTFHRENESNDYRKDGSFFRSATRTQNFFNEIL